MNIQLTFDESLKDVFSALCKDIQKRLGRGKRGRELEGEEMKDEIKSQSFFRHFSHQGENC